MFNVYWMMRPGYTWQAVVARTAGGCTAAESPKENARMARAAAANQHGGRPSDWVIIRHTGTYDNRETAELIAKYEAPAEATDA